MDHLQRPLEGLVDTHFHLLELQKRGIDPAALLDDLFAKGFSGGMDIGVSEADIADRAPFLAAHPRIRIAAGIGPWGAGGSESVDRIVSQFTSTLTGHPIDCIGEIGLDSHWDYGSPQRQEELFTAQLDLADSLGLPVSIHTRDADDAMTAILRSRSLPHSGILHCFSSSWQVAEAGLEKGLYISFAGPITYPKNDALRVMLARVPLNRLLLETDSPYLPPHPHRGTTNTPHRMIEIYHEAARLRDMRVTDLADMIRTNFSALFPFRETAGPSAM